MAKFSKNGRFFDEPIFLKENTHCNAKTINFWVQKRPFFTKKMRVVTRSKVFKEKKKPKSYLEMFESESIRLLKKEDTLKGRVFVNKVKSFL